MKTRKSNCIGLPIGNMTNEELDRICKVLDKKSTGYACPFNHPTHGQYLMITREQNYREGIKGYENIIFDIVD